MLLRITIAILAMISLVAAESTVAYPFKERLDFTPLARNHLLSSFNFEINSTDTPLYVGESAVKHYSVFPKSLGTVLQSTNTRELHLRFSQGWYDSEVWGQLPNRGSTTGGTGVELWAVLEAPDEETAFKQWVSLANSLSGMFCASLNFIDSSVTTYPVKVFQPSSSFLDKINTKQQLFLLRSALPREPICTENLTPFLKLLPTKGRAGVSSLLNGHKFFNSQWNSMAIDVTTECEDSTKCHYSMKENIDIIFYVPKTLERLKGLIPKPTPGEELRCDPTKKMSMYHCFPMGETTEYRIDLKEIFGKGISGGALIANEPSKVCAHVDLDNWEVAVSSTSDAESTISRTQEEKASCFELTSAEEFNMQIGSGSTDKILPLKEPPVVASRSLSGFSQDSGGLRIDLTNPTSTEKEVVLFQTFPWFVRLYLHSLVLSVKDGKSYNVKDPQINHILKEIIYDSAIDRKKPTLLELSLSLPAHTSIKLTLHFDKSMLLYAEYPPDANHGFEIEPAVISVFEDGKEVYSSRTTTALLTLPTPDFSMPYNVIILTSTVMSLAFGAIYNFLVKTIVTEEEAEAIANQNPIRKLLLRFRARREELKSYVKGLLPKKKKNSDTSSSDTTAATPEKKSDAK